MHAHLSFCYLGTQVETPAASCASVVHLMARQFCRLQSLGAQHAPVGPIPSSVLSIPISTPLIADAWQQALQAHPDREWVSHLVTGIRQGFRIGLLSQPRCRSTVGSYPSASSQAEVITSFLASQVQAGYITGPLPAHLCTGVITSRMAVVPKKTPGKFRVIVDLSSPDNYSVNDNIHRELTHVAYSSVDDAALLMHHLGPHTLMAKIDIQDAYRLVPVHPMDRSFLGVTWQDGVYVDCQLPFGLASAPAIFSALAEALEWILRSRGVRNVIHYLDDFLLLGAPGSSECNQALLTTLSTCQELGIPLASHKVEGPTTCLTFLGIELDSSSLSLKLPHDKLLMLRQLLDQWARAKCVRDLHQFQSLVGHLVHATQVVPLGKAYLNRLFSLAQNLKVGQFRRLNKDTRADIAWWLNLCSRWSGISVQQFLLLQNPAHHLFTDASGSWGCGAWSLPLWFQVPWQGLPALHSIALQELFPIVLACAVWGRLWQGTYVLCHSDNVAAVFQVNKLHARDPLAAHLLRCLAFFQAAFDFRIRAVHISGQFNTGADDLSRDRASKFLAAHPAASPHPTQVSSQVLDLLFQYQVDWTSHQWRQLCGNFWRQV